nr:hypothetical protein [Tanacetum cinerariifolium]
MIKECSSCGALYTTDYCCSNESLVDKIICDLNKAPDSPHLHTFSSNQRHCFHCKDVLGDSEFCQRCTCTRCRSGLSKGLCLICKHNQNSLNDSPSISENSSQSPPHINHHCCYKCGDPLEVPIIPNPKPFNNQTIKELPPTFPSFDSKSDLVHDYPNIFDPPPQLPFISCELCGNDARYGHYCTPQVLFVYPKPDMIFNNKIFVVKITSDDQSFSDEDLSKKIYLNPLFDEEIIPMKIDHHHYNAESDLIESLLNHDSLIISSSKIDSLFDEFAGELTLLKSIPPGIDETDCYLEEESHFIKRLLYDNSSPRPPKEFVSENSDTEIESFSPSPISLKDSNSLMEEIDLSFTLDYPMPSGIEDNDHDSERDILISE